MAVNVNGVKTGSVAQRRYHHGDLRTSLIEAALEIIEEVGPDAFSLRGAARRAGVSPAAPAHHFRDARGLLTAIATVGFVEFGDALEAAIGPDRRSTIVAQCHAYLRFALARPGLFRLMWRKEALDIDDPEHVAAARRAFAISDRVVRGGDAVMVSPGDPALSPTIACWSMIHGFVALIIDGAFFAREAEAAGALDIMLDATLRHLNIDQEWPTPGKGLVNQQIRMK
jgi:AcrR family transcriptional regulator